MSDFESLYREFASLTHYPVDQFKVFKSTFPLLQNVACRHMKILPPDVPFWNSAVPFLVVLGRAKQADFNNADGTNCLIVLNTLHVINHVLKANSYLELDKYDIDDLLTLYNMLADILEKFKEPLQDSKSCIVPIIDGIHEIAAFVKERNQDNEAFLILLKKVIRNTKKCTLYIRSIFTCTYFNTDYEELVPLVMQFFLDIQTVGIFECLADRYQDFSFNENQLIEGFRLLFTGQQDQAHQIFLDQSEKFKEDAQKQLSNGRVAIFCAAASKAAGVSAFELAKGADDANVMKYYQSFAIPQYQPVPFEFSNSIITLLKMIINKQPNHELTTQLATSLSSHTSDQQLKYICSAAAYFPNTEFGYIALMGAYLPIQLVQKISHLEQLTNVVSYGYTLTDTETRGYINELHLDMPSHISEVFNSLPQIKSLADAEQSFAVILAVYRQFVEKGTTDIRFNDFVTNLNHLLCAWIISIAAALQAATITFVPNAIATIEKNCSIKQEYLEKIHQAYDVVCKLSLNMATPVIIGELISNVSQSMLAILPLVEELIQDPPLSLVDSEGEFTNLLNFSEIAIRLFEQLQKAATRVEFESSVYNRHQIISIINPIYTRLQQISQTLSTQPESVPSLIAETRMELTSYMNVLYNIDRSVDIKKLTDDFTTLTTTTDVDVMKRSIASINDQVSMITTQAQQAAVSTEELQKIDVNDNSQLSSLITMIANPQLQQASYDLINVIDEYSQERGLSDSLRDQSRDQILKLITLRINGYQQLDLKSLLLLSDEELKNSAVDIYAALPLYAGSSVHQVQELAMPLLVSSDPSELRLTLNKIVNYLTITLPLQEQLHADVIKLKEEPDNDFSADLEDLVRNLQLNIPLSTNDDHKLRCLYDTASLYSYSAKPEFSDEYLLREAELILQTKDPLKVQEIAIRVSTNLILSSVINGHYSENTLYKSKVLLKAAEDYVQQPTEANHRAVYGAVLQLPTNLDKFGQMNDTFLDLVAHAVKNNQNIPNDDTNSFYTFVNPETSSFESAILSVPDPVPVVQERKVSAKIRKIKPPPKIVRRVIKKTHPPPPIIVKKTIKHIVKVRRNKNKQEAGSEIGNAESLNIPNDASSSERGAVGSGADGSAAGVSIPGAAGADGAVAQRSAAGVPLPGAAGGDGAVAQRSAAGVPLPGAAGGDGSGAQKPPTGAGVPLPTGAGGQGGATSSSIRNSSGLLSLNQGGAHRSSAAIFASSKDFMSANTLRCIKLIESSRASSDCMHAYKKGVQENSPNLDSILAEFMNYSVFLSSLLSESQDTTYQSLNSSLEEVRSKVADLSSNPNPNPEEVDHLSDLMDRIVHDVVFLNLQNLGVTSNAQAELSLMASKVEQIQSQLDESLQSLSQDMEPLQQRVASSARDIFKLTKDLGLEARNQTEFLQRTNTSLSDEKGLIKAAMQTSDAAQMFFILLNLFAIKDPDIKYKVVAACKGMRVALTNIIVNLRAKGGSNEIAKRIENISEQIFEKLQYILELAEELINQESTISKSGTRKGVSKIVQRRNADSEVFKKRRALEEAENEIKRLNRAAAKVRGGQGQ